LTNDYNTLIKKVTGHIYHLNLIVLGIMSISSMVVTAGPSLGLLKLWSPCQKHYPHFSRWNSCV